MAGMAGFDEGQLQQISLAESEYGNRDSEIRKHPEWSGTFMNYFLHSEGKGEDCGMYFELADFLSRVGLPSDKATGKLGSSLSIFSRLVSLSRLSVPLPEPDRFDGSGNVDEDAYRFRLLEAVLAAKGKERLLSGRFAYSDAVGIFDEDDFFSEGIPEVKRVLDQLSLVARQYGKRTADPSDAWGSVADNAFLMASVKLSLDDMGIRGRQVVDALGYAGGSVQHLYRMLNRPMPQDTRDPDLVRYVNDCSARRILSGESVWEYVAVPGGASFYKAGPHVPLGMCDPRVVSRRFRMGLPDCPAYLWEGKPVPVDWRNVDIIDGIDYRSAVKAAVARGFWVLREGPWRDSFGDRCRSVLLYNKDTGAFLHAGSAKEDSFCYGGANLDFWLQSRSRVSCLFGHASSGCPSGCPDSRWYSLSYQDGLFSEYDGITDAMRPDAVDWDRLGFGSHGMPVPMYWEFPFFRDDELSGVFGDEAAAVLRGLGNYHMALVMNMVVAHYDTGIDLSVCPQYAAAASERMWGYVAECFGMWSSCEVDGTLALAWLVKDWLGMPDGEHAKMLDALEDHADRHYARQVADIMAWDNVDESVRQSRVNALDDVGKTFRRRRNVWHPFPGLLRVKGVLEAHGALKATELGVGFPW